MRGNRLIKWRGNIVLGGIIIFAVLIIFRLYTVQIVNADYYATRADRQYLGPNRDVFDRGSIYFTSKDGDEIAAATLKTGYKIAINPSVITEPEDVFNNLALDLDLDVDDFLYRTSKTDDPYEELARRVDSDSAEKIIERNIDGVSVFKEKWRFYPGNNLASHIVGFMSYSGDELRGQYGLEREYNEVLSRSDDKVFSNFFVEIFSNFKDVVVEGQEMKGSLITTIEPTVQEFLERELTSIDQTWGSKITGGIVMHPGTGEIYAMSVKPDFNLNEFNLVNNSNIYTNHLVESSYELGSIIKPLTIAVGLDTGKITADSTYEDKGSRTLDGFTFRNHDKEAHGVVDMQEVLNKSLNLGVAHVVDLVGNETFANYLKKLFDDKTGIDLPNEAYPLISNLDSPTDIEYRTASFGQGIAMTPISAIRALASLGNGGYIVQPHLVKRVEYKSGLSKKVKYDKGGQVFSKETSEEISRMLVEAVDTALLNGNVALDRYSIAAKTGTAQIALESGAGYYEDKYLHSFFGYFPAYDPEFIILLYTTEPYGAAYASETLVTPFINLSKFIINYYNLPPDRGEDVIYEENT